jgi:ribonuclease-3
MDALQQRIGYHFRDAGLLKLALTHPSAARGQNNQRLEFLGDAVLALVVSRILYELYPAEQEGELARRRAALVRGETLAQVARDIELGTTLRVGVSETQGRGWENPSNLEDAMEAVIGALYLDGGLETAEAFIAPRWTEIAKQNTAPPKDAKTSLQEWAQARGLPIPSYNVIESTGPAHSPVFTIEVVVQGHPSAQAKAPSKRAAEQEAAGMLLVKLGNKG